MIAPLPASFCRFVSYMLAGLMLLGSTAAGDQQDRRLEQFLERLGLSELQAVHLEQQLNAHPNNRLNIARRLADLYAAQLIATAEDEQQYAGILQRIKRLLDQVPQARTPSLEVMLLQADYHRAEELIQIWLGDRGNVDIRQQVAAVLNRIAPQLVKHQQALSERVKRLLQQADGDPEISSTDAASELQQLQSIAGRAGYFAAWSTYYLALISTAPASAGFDQSRRLFQQLLGMGQDEEELDPEVLGLESIWRARAVIGLALSEAGAGNSAASDQCFSWLEHGSVPLSIKDEVPYWQLQALLNTGRHAEAIEFARRQITSFSASASPSRVSFCIALVRAGFAAAGRDAPRELGLLGIEGLSRLRQHAEVRRLVRRYEIEITAESGFYLQWIKAQELLERARKGGKEGYRAAAEVFAAALASPDAQQDLAAAALCRGQLAWCYYQLGELERAARLFEQAAVGLQAADDPGAVEFAWRAFRAYWALSETEKRFVSAAIEMLKQIKRDFPQHEYAARADHYLAKLQQNASTPAETLADLERVRPDAPNYLAARYDICVLLYNQWTAAAANAQLAALGELEKAVKTYLRAARRDTDDGRKLKCCLLVARAALDSAPEGMQMADDYLGQAARLVDRPSVSAAGRAEYHYLALLSARKKADSAAQRQHVDWLVTNGRGSPYEKQALLLAAKSLEQQIKATPENGRSLLLIEAADLYRRLSALLGDRPAQLSGDKNARVALSRTAYYAGQLGRSAEAARRLEQLLAAFPKDKGYIRRAGLAHYRAGDYAQAIVHWRTLLSGTKRGSADWFEAKYYQLSCLSHLDSAKFRQALRQFQLLYPKKVAPAWRDKFEELREN